MIDANFWALRAIAFLANVEAVYFYKEDQCFFNPYAGQHPPYKLMDSLRAQFYAVVFILFITTMFFVTHVALRTSNFSSFGVVARGNSVKVFMWLLPLLLFLPLLSYTLSQWQERISDYLGFVRQSPGPGMISNRGDIRLLDPKGATAMPEIVSGNELQGAVREQLEKSEGRWKTWLPLIKVAIGVLMVSLLILLLSKGRIVG